MGTKARTEVNHEEREVHEEEQTRLYLIVSLGRNKVAGPVVFFVNFVVSPSP